MGLGGGTASRARSTIHMDASPFLRRENGSSNDRAREFGFVCRDGLWPDDIVAPAQVRGGAILSAGDGAPVATRARASFDEACSDLHAAVAALTEFDGETVMVTDALVGLLGRVAAARRHLADAERQAAWFLPASLR